MKSTPDQSLAHSRCSKMSFSLFIFGYVYLPSSLTNEKEQRVQDSRNSNNIYFITLPKFYTTQNQLKLLLIVGHTFKAILNFFIKAKTRLLTGYMIIFMS